ncbi:MAG: hypothetical protein GX995_07310 [Clostridiales bacterium]|nr:hypothetical protein [Clostridiales bacterium]
MEENIIELISIKDNGIYVIKHYEGFEYEIKVLIWKKDLGYQVIIAPIGNMIYQPEVTYDEKHGGKLSFGSIIDIEPSNWPYFLKSAKNALDLCKALRKKKDLTRLES